MATLVLGYSLLPVSAVLVTIAGAAWSVEDCPRTCPKDVTDPVVPGPPGTSYLLLAYASSDGTGTGTDCATCTQCTASLSFQFNGNGTAWCIRFDNNGSGWSNWLPNYARFGKLFANCAFDGVPGESTFCAEVNNCSVQLQNPPVTECIVLNCGCQ